MTTRNWNLVMEIKEVNDAVDDFRTAKAAQVVAKEMAMSEITEMAAWLRPTRWFKENYSGPREPGDGITDLGIVVAWLATAAYCYDSVGDYPHPDDPARWG